MKKTFFYLAPMVAASLWLGGCCSSSPREVEATAVNEIRPPATPLVTVDPYFSVWSFDDQVNEAPTRHWTGKEHPLVAAIRVDGKTYRVLGKETVYLDPILPTVAIEGWEAQYVNREPAGNWTKVNYNDKAWKTGPAAFGTKDMPNIGTPWREGDIWVRRTFELDQDLSAEELVLEYSHDDVFELYVNGIQVANTGNTWRNNVQIELNDVVKSTLKPGKNVIAAHCHNTVGGAYVDFGLFRKDNLESCIAQTAQQKSVNVLPTRTFYTFECPGVDVDLIFTAPFLLDDLQLASQPFNYVTYQVRSNDGQEHAVQFYFETTPQLAVHNDSQPVVTTRGAQNGISYLKTGTVEQPILGRKGDNVRIDWGYLYLAAPEQSGALAIADYFEAKKSFINEGTLPESADSLTTENMLKEKVALAYCHDLGKVGPETVSNYLMLAYDDLYSIQYFQDNLLAYWKQDGMKTIESVLTDASKNYNRTQERCAAFDAEMMDEALKAGGKEYAELCALAYRQSIAAHKLVKDKEGNLLFFSKENFSNGSIGTVDITYPSSPLYLIYNPELLKGMMNPIFYYTESGRWTKPFAAHDVGTYPLANGQTYGGDMPVEESGNMLILSTAIALMEGNADYAAKHWDALTTWADYLVKEGMDPANQLCTDDFAGHFAHNTNLSIKAIMGIAGYGKLAQMLGKEDVAEKYLAQAREMAAKWPTMASDGDHYRLTFDKPGTWSQKYNIVWDKILGLNIFDPEIAQTEVAYYLTHQNRYGLPLDSRKTYTKSDWIMWTACLTDDPNQFKQFVVPVYNYANETQTRMPLSDWHETTNGNSVGFRARSVVGGYFMRMLEGRMVGRAN